VTHEPLLLLYRSTCLIEPRTIRVAKRMPHDPFFQADEFGCLQELTLPQAFLVVGLPYPRVGEDPVLSAEKSVNDRHRSGSLSRRGSRGERNLSNTPFAPLYRMALVSVGRLIRWDAGAIPRNFFCKVASAKVTQL
jgi:hypothetical protein